MELKTFITQTLTDIVEGVADAQKKLPDNCVIPAVKNLYKSVETGISEIQAIEFEVSVRADEHKGSEAKLTVVAAFFGGQVKGNSRIENGHSAVLRFKVPVKFPLKDKTP